MDLVALRNRLIDFAKVVEGKRYYAQIVDYRANSDLVVFAGSCYAFHIRTNEWPAETYDREFDLKSLNDVRESVSIELKLIDEHFGMITKTYQSLRALHGFRCPQCFGCKTVQYECKTKWKDFRKILECPICQGKGVLDREMIDSLLLQGIYIDTPYDISVEIPGLSMSGKFFCEIIDLAKWFGLDRIIIDRLDFRELRRIQLCKDVCMFFDTFALNEYHVDMRSVLGAK